MKTYKSSDGRLDRQQSVRSLYAVRREKVVSTTPCIKGQKMSYVLLEKVTRRL